jgi:hypothetical protein
MSSLFVLDYARLFKFCLHQRINNNSSDKRGNFIKCLLIRTQLMRVIIAGQRQQL